MILNHDVLYHTDRSRSSTAVVRTPVEHVLDSENKRLLALSSFSCAAHFAQQQQQQQVTALHWASFLGQQSCVCAHGGLAL